MATSGAAARGGALVAWMGGQRVWVVAILALLRLAGAGLLAEMAWIHVDLYVNGYSTVPTIGLLFLLNGIGGAVLTLAVLVTPHRYLALVAGASALFTAGTLGALVLSLGGSLFGFSESMSAPLVSTTLGVESAGVVELALLTVLALVLREPGRSVERAPGSPFADL